MKVTLFPCGPAANESELKAAEHLKNRLQNEGGDGHWVLMTNVAFSVTHQLQSDEIDIVAIGPPGVRVIEVKHWTAQWVDANPDLVAQEADRVTNKARKIGTTLRRYYRDLARVDGSFLLTQEPSKVKRLGDREVRGVRLHTLSDWKAAIDFGSPTQLSPQQIEAFCRALEPKSAVAIDGSLRRLAGYVNLERQTPRDERFHRIYRGTQPSRRDRVILHLYDLSASDDKNAEAKAKREFDALHQLQLFPWAPRILDSYQEAPGYAGEMFFFTVVDPAAPSVDARASDQTWDTMSRIAFARAAVTALGELHGVGTSDGPFVHRGLTAQTILVKHDNSPILTGLDRAKIPSDTSVASSGPIPGPQAAMFAPEVRAQGLGAADQRSDVYGACQALLMLFDGREDSGSVRAAQLLSRGVADDPDSRPSIEALRGSLGTLLGDSIERPPVPPARYWTEEQEVRFHGHDYRIIARLGSGGMGTTFKVVEIERSTREELGTYVAKIGHDRQVGEQIRQAYRLARSHLGGHPGLSAVFEYAEEWRENEFVALMKWIDGAPLSDFTGVFPLLAEELQETSPEALALRWLRTACEALNELHRNGLVHGDVSPRNMIVSGSDLVLTDYDFVHKIGEMVLRPGTVLYCSDAQSKGRGATPADDLFALAASVFQVLFDRQPFQHGGAQAKERGLNWDGIPRDQYPTLVAFLDRATNVDVGQRPVSAREAIKLLQLPAPPAAEFHEGPSGTGPDSIAGETANLADAVDASELREREVAWLKNLLQSYPGSPFWGNVETRGLDSRFAVQTYVETELEEALDRDIRARRIRLVVLCGNAGDGKTALLQHLAGRLGLGRHSSSDRIVEGGTKDGLLVRMNLDGSAAWRGRSADELLDEFLAPFQQGRPEQDIAHLLAINDGRLLEWIEGVEQRLGGSATPLTTELYALLQQEGTAAESHIRFISLNQRSLVGGISPDGSSITSDFLHRLLDHLFGGDDAKSHWAPCSTCTAKARCEVYRATRIFGPSTIAGVVAEPIKRRARDRLFEALQAVHLRGETHITVRELRAALAYIVFGVHHCKDYHAGITPEPLPYWDRAFSPTSPGRQGELLRELARFDPALEAHPQVDRYLLSSPMLDGKIRPPSFEGMPLSSARRRAYFEWTQEHVSSIASDAESFGLARGRHLGQFRGLALGLDVDKLCARLVGGMARLEDLPPAAFNRPDVVPFRVTPRTPTETAFWIEKPISAFRIEPDLPNEIPGVERLHRHVFLVYRYRERGEERLRLGAELFHLLLELNDGYQLGDVSTDDTFANLSIFVQRLVREDERELIAWTPIQDDRIYHVIAHQVEREEGLQQQLVLRAVSGVTP